MNIKELHSFKLSDAVALHSELNPALFKNDKMRPEVRAQLLKIAEDFIDHLGISNFDVQDITLSGSNAAYSYTRHSDIDLHIITDMSAYSNDEIYQELFTAKKTVYNDTHDIKIAGYDVELYVQPLDQPHVTLGDYSVLNDKWRKHPVRRRANFDTAATKLKFEKLAALARLALRSQDLERVQLVLDTIKKYRKAGLDQQGEFGPENLAYKAMRSRGIMQKLFDLRDELHSAELSIREQAIDEDRHPNDKPYGPETKPTMPAGTVRVDVSDVYDWYKLGQHISDMKGLGKHDFGQGPPSTIFSFGSEDAEHKYIKDLERTGLTTTDIDPRDPKQPSGMKKQKTDPTYNVKESASGYIPSEREKNDPRFKTALTVDIKPDTLQKNARKLGFKISRAGIPPLLR